MQTQQLMQSMSNPSPHNLTLTERKHAAAAKTKPDGRVHSSIVAVVDAIPRAKTPATMMRASKTRDKMHARVSKERVHVPHMTAEQRLHAIWRCMSVPSWLRIQAELQVNEVGMPSSGFNKVQAHREKDKIVKAWELVADAVYGFTALRAL